MPWTPPPRPEWVTRIQSLADAVGGQAQWSLAMALAGLAFSLSAPFLGAVADAGGRRRLMLGAFTLLTTLDAAFTNHAGELHFTSILNASNVRTGTMVEGDVNGDGVDLHLLHRLLGRIFF